MNSGEVVQAWRTDGFAVLPGFLPASELAPALAELGTMFPSADGFHDRTDPRYRRYLGDEFAGIDAFPFASPELSLLAVHDRLADLAEILLADPDLRIYSAEAWAKYTGAADYDQALHRDYLNHTVLVPTAAPAYEQVEMFVYLVDVPDELGPPHLVSRARTAGRPAKPNWYPRADGSDDGDGFVSADGSPELYAAEVSAAGPAGTVVAFGPGTFHRGTALTAPRGARYTMHLGYRPATAEWGHRHAWAGRSHDPAWYRFVARASPRQLRLFGFPPPGHPFWTPETVSGTGLRYPGRDWTDWLAGTRP
jgi:Phytanoyl-CoA dioxygenase (PhyH)